MLWWFTFQSIAKCLSRTQLGAMEVWTASQGISRQSLSKCWRKKAVGAFFEREIVNWTLGWLVSSVFDRDSTVLSCEVCYCGILWLIFVLFEILRDAKTLALLLGEVYPTHPWNTKRLLQECGHNKPSQRQLYNAVKALFPKEGNSNATLIHLPKQTVTKILCTQASSMHNYPVRIFN